jgi:TolB-like protein
MKPGLFFFVLCLFAALFAGAPALQGQTLPRLAVVDFDTNINIPKVNQAAVTVRNLVESQLVATRQYQVITRTDIDRLLANQQIQVSSIASSENIRKLQLQNISYIVTGSVNAMDNDYLITVKMLDVSTGQFSHSADTFTGSEARDLYNGVTQLVSSFAAGMTSRDGQVAQVAQPSAARPGPANAGGDASLGETIRGIDRNLARIPGGTFMMGSIVGQGNTNERPQRQISLGDFSIGKYEVTQAEYEAVMGSNPSAVKDRGLPVETVSWLDAAEFCNRLSRAANVTPAYTISGVNVTWNRNANGYRLPTEAEWEYACGEWVDGWLDGNSGRMTHPVGQLAPNRYGLYDMTGNVQEWCWDWYGSYGRDAQSNPPGPGSGTTRVRRGHSFQSGGRLFVTNRDYGVPREKNNTTGFRIARSGF